MAACQIGEFAKSIAGHDKNEIFIINNIENEYVYLVDGKNRIVENPKKKKIKHIRTIHIVDEDLRTKINSNVSLRNEDIKKALKNYKANKLK